MWYKRAARRAMEYTYRERERERVDQRAFKYLKLSNYISLSSYFCVSSALTLSSVCLAKVEIEAGIEYTLYIWVYARCGGRAAVPSSKLKSV